MASVEHPMQVTYTNRDDGLWLYCEACPFFSESLDFFPTPEYIAERAAAHRVLPLRTCFLSQIPSR